MYDPQLGGHVVRPDFSSSLSTFLIFSSLAFDRSPMTDSFRRTMFLEEDVGIVGYGVKRLIHV